jgi:hypothetical protein
MLDFPTAQRQVPTQSAQFYIVYVASESRHGHGHGYGYGYGYGHAARAGGPDTSCHRVHTVEHSKA